MRVRHPHRYCLSHDVYVDVERVSPATIQVHVWLISTVISRNIYRYRWATGPVPNTIHWIGFTMRFLCLGLHFGIRHVYLSGTSTGWRRFSINHLSWNRIFVFSKLMGVEKCSWKMGSDSRVVDPKMMDLVKSWPNIKYPHNVKLAYIYCISIAYINV